MSNTLSSTSRIFVLSIAFTSLMFDGFELGLMPVVSLSFSKSLLGEEYTAASGGAWFANYTAALMFGAALGGIALGWLGDRYGRTRALGVSVLLYSVFAGWGAYAQSQEQMLWLRFAVGLGVGGVWPNAVALVAECWPDKSRPFVAGIMGVAINAGIFVLSQVAKTFPLTPDSWRWIFQLAGLPALLGLLILLVLPESPRWLASRQVRGKPETPLQELLRPPLLTITMIGIILGTIPLLGAWGGSKWMIPWADQVGGAVQPGYKAQTQQWWSLGAIIGSFCGAQVASLLGRRRSYFLISLGSTCATITMFQWTKPLEPTFFPVVFVQGAVSTLFFGWLPLYLPELFPTQVRASGVGLSYNVGRFATAAGVFGAGALFQAMGENYPRVGTALAFIYSLGMLAIWWAPDTTQRSLDRDPDSM